MKAHEQELSLESALRYLAGENGQILSGGTDYFPSLSDAVPAQQLLSVHRVRGLDKITRTNTHWRIGAGVTWTSLINASLPNSFDCLKQAGREVGSVQIQNAATLAGNICNASPAADGVPAMLVLNAQIELRTIDSVRVVPLTDFIIGVRKTILKANEMVTAILIPHDQDKDLSAFVKLGARTYLVISIVMCATRIRVDSNNIITDAAVAVGSCSPVAQRITLLENALVGLPCQKMSLAACVKAEHLQVLEPIADVRATAEYRMQATKVLLQRQIESLAQSLTAEGSA